MLFRSVLAEVTLTSKNCKYEIKGTEGSRYLKIYLIYTNGEVRVPDNMAVPTGGKNVLLPVKEVVAKSDYYSNYKVTKYIFEPNIEKVEIPGDYNRYVKSVIFEGDNTQVAIDFLGSSTLEEVRLPANITQFETLWDGPSTFRGCEVLKRVILPEKLKEIPAYFFKECPNLTTLVIPNSVTKIGREAFSGSGISQITLSENLTTIEAMAFSGSELSQITLPESLTGDERWLLLCFQQVSRSSFSEIQFTSTHRVSHCLIHGECDTLCTFCTIQKASFVLFKAFFVQFIMMFFL